MEFRCRLATASGQISEGVFTAESEAALRRELEEKGLYVLDLKSARPGLAALRRSGAGGRIKLHEFLVFNQELATLLKAGMPLVQSLDILRRNIPNPVFKGVLDDVYEKVRSGTALSDAFEAHPRHVTPIYTASLMAGERSGSLEQVLRRYVAYVQVLGAVRRKVVSALVYPAVLTLLSIGVVAIIVVRVVPQFNDFYAGFGAELPLATRMIVALSNGIRSQLPLLALLAVGAVFGGRWLLQQPAQRQRLDRVILQLPGLGGIARQFATSQLSRTLATLLGGGIPLVTALDVASRSVSNRHIAAQMTDITRQVREGQPLSTAMAAKGEFPDVSVKMVEVGEATGALQDMLNAIADFYDEDIETKLGRFLLLIEPVLLVVMGIVIAALLIALYLPVFQLSSALS
ncbi:type II secretion system protein [Luteitalea sp. TBR-22]|uniref:type II secretion system F family protein n=1 Tax=Luteitalea sp. TBR-22 TaxID=2802971 RepID=UPI001AFBF474|nr:type II secretion system F family protein [Luteitalea sp. TBR-22]BCS33334.1 type II secretion system protein [Luteitalea sp. TBR-22]